MIGSLRWIAGIGLGVGVVSLAIAYALGGHDLSQAWRTSNFGWGACGEGRAGMGSERHLAWSGGDTIEISLPASVRLRMGEGKDIVVRGSPDVVSRVDVVGDRLFLDCHWRAPARDIEIILPGQTFRQIGVSGSARLDLMNLNQAELRLRIRGSGSVRAQGSVDRLSLRVSGSGDSRLAELAIKSLTLKISGSGEVEAAPKEAADVSISGSGTLKLLSRPPHLNTHIAGSGRVVQLASEASGKN